MDDGSRVAVVFVGDEPSGLALLVDDRTALTPPGVVRPGVAVGAVGVPGGRHDIASGVTSAGVLVAVHIVQPVAGVGPLVGESTAAGGGVRLWCVSRAGWRRGVDGRLRAPDESSQWRGGGRSVTVSVPPDHTALGSPVVGADGGIVGVVTAQRAGQVTVTDAGELAVAVRACARRF